MKISIGILAHNEALSIEKTFDSLFQQSLFQASPPLEIEIICVPNGCSDDTADVCRQVLEKQVLQKTVTWQVSELTAPGKPNAWNHYIHEVAAADADYVFLMDADIWFNTPETLMAMVDLLQQQPSVWVAVDQPIKDVLLKAHKNPAEHLSVMVSELSGSGDQVWLCGQLYCARAAVLRRIYMPTELSADDGFLYEMITTNCLTTASQPDRIARAQGASHVFEAYTNPQQLIKHERWLVIANIVNALIFDQVHRNAIASSEAISAAKYFRDWDQQNPQWVSHLIRTELTQKSGWLTPPDFLQRRFTNLQHKPWLKRLLLTPLATIALGVDLLTLYTANRHLARSLRSDSTRI
jgi:Glycosyl transferase family 2